MPKYKRLTDSYRFAGFTPSQIVKGIFGDPRARVITYTRLKKKPVVRFVTTFRQAFMIVKCDAYVTCPVATLGSIWIWKSDASSARGVRW